MKDEASGKSEIKVSFLVPIYNAERFLTPCLESLHTQTLKEIEVLCLNDGSSDNSLTIMRQYAQKDSRFRIISKKNTGYGDTMNQGIRGACGEYIGIVEADDFIEPDMAEFLYTHAQKYQADIAKSDYYLYKHDRDWRQQLLPVTGDQPNLQVAQVEYLLTRPATIWTALYRREFLTEQQLSFLDLSDHRFQDSSFAFKTLACAHRVYYTTRAFYHYRQHPGQSVVSRAYPTAILKEYQETERFLRERGSLQDWAAALTLAKFYGYKWNTARLPYSIARKFVTLATSDWKKMQAEEIYQTRLFSWRESFDTFLARRLPEAFIIKAKLARWKERG
ncbi:glycosyltransferase [bacterium]|nr:glycosyltransferase [bacterium]